MHVKRHEQECINSHFAWTLSTSETIDVVATTCTQKVTLVTMCAAIDRAVTTTTVFIGKLSCCPRNAFLYP